MTLMNQSRPLYRIFENGFTEDDIKNIPVPQMEQAEVGAADVGEQGVRENIRISKTGWIYNEHLLMYLYRFVNQANMESFQTDVHMWADIQYTVYEGGSKGHYDWHQDVMFNGIKELDRKLSCTVQLTDGSEYEGGDFEIDGAGPMPPAVKKKGTVLIFPSYLQHRVTPVTSGTRKSLVAWFEGPHWR